MKSLILFAILICVFTISLSASPNQSSLLSSDTTTQNSLNHLLNQYYSIKDALFNSNAAAADSGAENFLDTIQKIDLKSLTQSEREAFMSVKDKLIADTKNISQSKDLSKQRINFSTLSDDFYSLAKKVKITTEPIYRDYCPMKKKYWLSSISSIKNPYYGKVMPKCGSIVETLK